VVVELSLVTPLVDEGPGPRGAVEEAAVEKVLPYCSPVVAAMLRVQLYTGMRPGEVVQMRAGDVDRFAGQSIPHLGDMPQGESVNCWLYRPRRYKSRRSSTARAAGGRRVWLGPKAQAVLTPWLAGKSGDDPVFPSSRGTPFRERSYYTAVLIACDRAGVARFQVRQLRHTALTAVEEAFGSIDYAQAVGGHTRPDVTRRYSHARDKLAKEAAARLG